MATSFWKRYCSLMVTWDSKTLMGKVRAAFTVMMRSSLSASAISSGVSFLPKITSQ